MASNVAYVMEVPTWVGSMTPGVGGTGDQMPPGAHVAKWTLNFGDDGMPFDAPNYSGKSVSAEGTFGGSTVNVEGRDGQSGSWIPLHNPGGTVITFTALGKQQILEDVKQVRFTVTGGAASGLTCRLIVTTSARRG